MWSASLESHLDQFTIYRGGSVWANDTFSDGVTPPSGEGFFGASASPMTYYTQGTFKETGGKLFMDSQSQGQPVLFSLVNANNGTTVFTGSELARVHTGRALSNASQSLANASSGLKESGATFDVFGLYDLVSPTTNTNNYGIGLVDNTGSPASDRMRLSVLKPTNSALPLRVQFWRNDQTINPQENLVFGQQALDVNHDQILLRLSRNNAANNEITASYAYVDGANVGMDVANPANLASLTFNTIANVSAQPATIFNDAVHTRAEFRQLARDADNRFDFARLSTGSPISMAQDVFTGATPSNLTFNYRFETTSGTFTVMLGTTLLDTIFAPGTITDDFSSASYFIDGGLLNQTLPLTFTLDGPTGSKILLDTIGFQGLQNANFGTGDLTSWDITASGAGSAGVITIAAAVPEPETYALMLVGLGFVGFVARRRKLKLQPGA